MSPSYCCYILGLVIFCAEYHIVNGSPSKRFLSELNDAFEDNKRNIVPLAQIDEDVMDLEQLQSKNINAPHSPISTIHTIEDAFEKEAEQIIQTTGALPGLEKELENEMMEKTTLVPPPIGQPEHEEEMIVQHKSPHAPGTGKHPATPEQKIHELADNDKSPSPAKSFHGAARLTFGQHPETTSTTTSTISTLNLDEISEVLQTTTHSNIEDAAIKANDEIESSTDIIHKNDKILNESAIIDELKPVKSRRSVDRLQPKNAEALLKHAESSFDMAQYIFWTGDEAGVAKAVEEFIQQGLMSRENALKFLKEIRIGINYLQKSFDNRILSEQKANNLKKSDPLVKKQPDYYENVQIHEPIEQHQILNNGISSQLNYQRALESLPSLLRLQEIHGVQSKDNAENYEDNSGRARIAEFLYSEYSLEEIIYQLAKVMFSQSLSHGSEQSQNSLQRLTEFLEREGERGTISPGLQKKILEVLLAALSDILADHPELLAAARSNLGNSVKFQHNNSILKH